MLTPCPTHDFTSIQSSYHVLFAEILQCESDILSLCLHSIISFMLSYPGDFYELVNDCNHIAKLKNQLNQLERCKSQSYRDIEWKQLQEGVDRVIEKNNHQFQSIREEVQKITSNGTAVDVLLKDLRMVFGSLKEMDRQSVQRSTLGVSKSEIVEWKELLDTFFPF